MTVPEHPEPRQLCCRMGPGRTDELTRGQQSRPSAQLQGCPGPQQGWNQGHAEDSAAEPGSEAGWETPVSERGLAEQGLSCHRHRCPREDPRGTLGRRERRKSQKRHRELPPEGT